MKLRYYLRGLGIGILVTAMIFTIIPGEKETLSDAEIRKRAEELGMVDSSSLVLSDLAVSSDKTKPTSEADEESKSLQESETTPSEEEKNDTSIGLEESMNADDEEIKQQVVSAESSGQDTNATTKEEESTGQSTNTGIVELPEKKENLETQQPPVLETTLEPVTVKPVANKEGIVKVTIRSGYGSQAISEGLAEGGLVQDAATFNFNLCSRGYSRSIYSGTFEVSVNITEEELLELITIKQENPLQ